MVNNQFEISISTNLIFPEGREITLLAIPNEGWNFVEWTGYEEGDNDVEITFSMNRDKQLELVFE